MKTRSLRRAAALLLALALACSLLTLPAAAASSTSATIVSMDKTLTLEVGGSGKRINIITNPPNAEVTWVSSAPTVAAVDDEGYVTPGTVTASTDVTITARTNGDFDTCTVTVNPKPILATSVTVTPDTLVLYVGDTGTVTASVDSNATNKGVKFESLKPSVVTVEQRSGSQTATLTPIMAGTAVIRATAADGSGKYADCEVTVKVLPLTVTITDPEPPKSLSRAPGEKYTIRATVSCSDQTAVQKGVEWFSSSSAVQIISSTPTSAEIEVLSSATAGTSATITARSAADPTKDDICTVYITGPQTPRVEQVAITSNSSVRYVEPKGTITLEAIAYPDDAYEKDREIEWSSDNTSVARVNGTTGVVTGVAPGEATITAKARGDNSKFDTRKIETSGILLSYRPSGGTGTESLTESSVVNIYQNRDISALWEVFGNAKEKSITWTSSNNTVAQALAGRVTASYPGEAVITATVDGTDYSAKFKVKVSEDVADTITVSMGSNPSYSFSSLMSQLDSRSQSKAGGPLESISSLRVSTQNGTLYYGYTSSQNPGHGVGGTERFYYQPMGQGQLALRDVTFVPLPGFDGTAVVEYNGTATNGTTFNGTIRIEATATGDVSYSTEVNQPVAFAAEHFSAVCMSRNGQAIRFLNFAQPAANRGTLYYNYNPSGQYSPKVESSTAYYVSSSPSINGITFVPAKDFAGTVDIAYRCTDSAGATYTGAVTITVRSAGGSTTATGDVEYSVARNQRQTFRTSDFTNACQRAIGGTLDYIRFTDLPSPTAGILYQNYTSSSSTRVPTGRSYYRSSSPYISDISFVPATNYSGTVSIPFTAANTSGAAFSGTLVIHVDDGVGTVHYSTPRNQPVTFSAADFNDASRRVNGASLNYVRFTGLPRSSAGTLYLNYVSSGSFSSQVSTGTNYYRSSSPSLSNITFVPANGYSGTAAISFTAYDDNGSSFNGTVTVAVGDAGRTVYYSTIPNGSVRFSGADFNSACRSATGNSLSYVRFSYPASYYGTLYYQYNSSSRTGNSVSSSTNFYYSGGDRLISDVSFAASSATGTVSFGYTGYSTGGDSFSGTVEIRISGSTVVGTNIRYAGSSAPIAFRASDFQNICQMMLGSPLSYVQFTPLPTIGHLNQNYSGPAQTGTGVTSAAHYGVQELDQISYLPKAEYQGTVYVPYTLYDTLGRVHSSSVEIQVSNDYNYSSFSDIASGYWASPSIEFLRSSGITNGYSNNTYRPRQSISRGEFTLMVCRAFQFPTTGSSGFPDVPANSTYAGAVASARNLGIVEGNNGLFQPDRPITRQSAMTMICRAMEVAGQAVPAADPSFLSSYVDAWQVSSFARSSVASLVQLGAVRGDSSMRLNPTAAISRAEMAVILHRVLAR